MSIRLMSQVWERDVDHPEQAVLLALADHANDDGEHVRPSLEYIAWKTGYSERQVRRLVSSLKSKGVLVLRRAGARSPNEYMLTLDPLPFKRPFVRVRDITPSFRAAIISRDGQTCSYCGVSGSDLVGPDGQPWHIDRVVPGSKGGRYVDSNVKLSCGTCNRSKGAKTAPKVTVPSEAGKGAILSDKGAKLKDADPSLSVSEPSETRARAYKQILKIPEPKFLYPPSDFQITAALYVWLAENCFSFSADELKDVTQAWHESRASQPYTKSRTLAMWEADWQKFTRAYWGIRQRQNGNGHHPAPVARVQTIRERMGLNR